MKTNPFGIAIGGEQRSRQAIDAQVRREHEAELAATNDYWQKVAIEEKIQRKVEEQISRVSSPYSLWNS